MLASSTPCWVVVEVRRGDRTLAVSNSNKQSPKMLRHSVLGLAAALMCVLVGCPTPSAANEGVCKYTQDGLRDNLRDKEIFPRYYYSTFQP